MVASRVNAFQINFLLIANDPISIANTLWSSFCTLNSNSLFLKILYRLWTKKSSELRSKTAASVCIVDVKTDNILLYSHFFLRGLLVDLHALWKAALELVLVSTWSSSPVSIARHWAPVLSEPAIPVSFSRPAGHRCQGWIVYYLIKVGT